MKKQTFYIAIFLFAFVQVIFSQIDSNENRPNNYNFKLGLNSNFIYDKSDFQSGFTGFGIFLEPFITDNFSLVLSINSFSIKTNKSGFIKTGKQKISTREIFFLLRYRFAKEKIVFYPEIGTGNWGNIAGYLVAGFGSGLKIRKDLFLSASVDYLVAVNNYSDLINNRGWTSSLLKININFSYLFILK